MIRAFIEKYYNIIFLVFLVVVGAFSYFLGVEQGRKEGGQGIIFSCDESIIKKQTISQKEIKSATVEQSEPISQIPESFSEVQGKYVGSKNGTKYYTPGCSGTNRIKPENYVWFQSVEDATLQGYSKGSC